jgi:phosphoribosylglycinamide formyltransferase 1
MKLVLMASSNGHLLDELKDLVILVLTDKDAPIIDKARGLGIPVMIIMNDVQLNHILVTEHFDHIMLCGYLKILPKSITDKFSIFNTHPSLLPKYGGMFGKNIHSTVLRNKDTETRVTVHKVTEVVDGGEIVAQKVVKILPKDTYLTLEHRVKQAEKILLKEFFNSLDVND